MSNAFLRTTAGNLPPVVATSYVTQDGTAVPAANILIVNGFDSDENNENGIITKGGVVGTGTVNEVDVVITNRITGTGTTTDGVTPVTLFTFPLGASPGTYLFQINVTVFDLTSSLSAGYVDFAAVRTTGAVAFDIGTQPALIVEEGILSTASVNPTINGNSFEFTVTGVAGETINWYVLATYIFVS